VVLSCIQLQAGLLLTFDRGFILHQNKGGTNLEFGRWLPSNHTAHPDPNGTSHKTTFERRQ
jgi:hypothetical protein